ncbi:MerR family transcriptional regulator [Paenibacillus sp. MBLB2552]|uniref:MerR family transcriptional regulator n=1 Tax=Paenibacillus mellifer TaxID=2937794 RepID=A0A9X1XYV7_9BACL|nr:MerR family transcriptional regulator [Paenibacillus mellifer]MCK8487824.1 MerR family transcriptional regulator [Paenibacillus mellifer]
MKYCIGEFSSLLGITRDTLRLYEKHDIVRPVKDHNNSYRYFNDLDARDLLMSRWYRSLQIPLQDVAGLIQNASLDDILDKMENSKQELEEQIRKSTMLLHKLGDLSREVQSMKRRLYECKLVDRPGLYRLKQTDKNDLLNTKGLECTINTLMELLPYSFYCFRIERESIESEAELLDYSWGLSISEDEVCELGIGLDEHLEYIPPSRCVSSVILAPQNEHFAIETFRFMLNYMAEHQYVISGAATGRLMLTENHEGTKRSFLEIHIPIEETY